MLSEFKQTVDEFFSQGWDGPATVVRSFSHYDVATSENIVGYQAIAVRVISFDYVSKTSNPDSLIKTGDKQLYIKPVAILGAIDPTTDVVEIAGIRHKIITVKEFNPSGAAAIYYELYVRA